MDDIVSKERIALRIKIMIFSFIILSSFYGIYKFLKPPEKAKFAALEALTFEALSLSKDIDHEKISFPSENINEIEGFFSNSLGNLGFTPDLLKDQSDYKPIGAMILDYEILKIAVTKWEHKTKTPKTPLIHFIFPESWDLIPKGVPVQEASLTYQSYSSQDINLISWQDQKNKNVVHFLAGFEKHQVLAQMAAKQ